ncbi:hypothetical protein CEXT_247791 [Caerostris extrusa]|uniref:Uncharacterized protein n=1 Tax=Caerostris extrusa TaxID=172846 RepID=A0AAV4MRL2_CAEEX|nr:hypothetical protein CEXT_247791 [Caerostris extrusa]
MGAADVGASPLFISFPPSEAIDPTTLFSFLIECQRYSTPGETQLERKYRAAILGSGLSGCLPSITMLKAPDAKDC